VVTVPGPNETPVPYGHPDNDLLADLAAEVLADDLALQVQHHVMSCARCAAILADAEGIRSWLRQEQPEVMPAQVLSRLERALLAARQENHQPSAPPARPGRPMADTGETTMLTRVPGGADPARKDGGRRIVRSGPATGRMPVTGATTGPMAAGGPKTGRLSRMSTSSQTQGLRRQAIEEQKADRPSTLARFLPIIKIAAGVLVVLGIGAVGYQFLGRGDSDAADTGATASGSAPILAPVQSTRTNYAKDELPQQIKTLITTTQKSVPEAGTLSQSDSAAKDAPAGSRVAGSDPPSPSGGPAQPGQLLRSPTALRACLKDIEAGDAQPVAVDLARYANQEAAIIVLPADGGGYDVWVVARDCRPGTDGTIAFVTVKP
jgi:hypothetical protein